jgi:hypothetical protein
MLDMPAQMKLEEDNEGNSPNDHSTQTTKEPQRTPNANHTSPLTYSPTSAIRKFMKTTNNTYQQYLSTSYAPSKNSMVGLAEKANQSQ